MLSLVLLYTDKTHAHLFDCIYLAITLNFNFVLNQIFIILIMLIVLKLKQASFYQKISTLPCLQAKFDPFWNKTLDLLVRVELLILAKQAEDI